MARLGKMVEENIDSTFLQETISAKVYFPKEFNSLYETNLCFMQDGNDYFQMGRVATLSDQLHEDDTLVNTVFIGVHYKDRQDRLTKYHPDGSLYEAYQQFIVKELIPLVDTLIPINPLGVVRTLMGDSLAGTFAILTALSYPKSFQKVIMQSPLIDDTVFSLIEQMITRRIYVYHSIGLKENAVWTSLNDEMDFITPNKKLATYLQNHLSHYEYTEIDEGNHTWKYWQIELPEVIEKMLG